MFAATFDAVSQSRRPLALVVLDDELLDAIFDELSRSHPPALAHCVLVSRAWSQVAYRHRFRNIACILDSDAPGLHDFTSTYYFRHRCAKPTSTTPAELALFIRTTPRVAVHVQSLFLCSGTTLQSDNLYNNFAQFRTAIASLPSLCSLGLSGFSLLNHLAQPGADGSFVPRPLHHLSIRHTTYISPCLGALFGLFSSIHHLEMVEAGCHPHNFIDPITRTPINSLSVTTRWDDVLKDLLPTRLSECIQASSLQSIDISAGFICAPERFASFVRFCGPSLRSIKLSRFHSHNAQQALDLSPCHRLQNLHIVIVAPFLGPPNPRPSYFHRVIELAWPSALQTVLGTSPMLSTLTFGLNIIDYDSELGQPLWGNWEHDPHRVVDRLHLLDWRGLERVIEARPMLQELHIQIDAQKVKNSRVFAALKESGQEIIRTECFKSQHARGILRVSIIPS